MNCEKDFHMTNVICQILDKEFIIATWMTWVYNVHHPIILLETPILGAIIQCSSRTPQ